ncbi:helix-turn-helix domain-containing protein [Hujiaoplasma nucleasis]|uniref:Helix-turn-helix domain-containing protein n=1 Tax=Hujiaoplasma nucleasis TaxID=2725268 RepID=A0A7L6N4T5_9MOLU|nr:nucleotidyltransferase domain-containing protein [Hujiaoplasma nucleasis]QLY40005.1 helix-turn-helix domain-containing protein [Hujiaoplasma nucleasis]
MSNNIKIVRENLELTQEQVSLLTGIPVKTLRNWEQEVRKPSEWTIDLVMDRLLRVKMEEYAKIDESSGVLSFLTIKENISKIAKNYDIEKVYLFGSYVKGQATQNSDVDLYMESDLYGLKYFEFVEQLRENLKKKVEVLSNKTVQEYSKIDEEIKKSGALIYER